MKFYSSITFYAIFLLTACYFFTSSCIEIMTYNIRRMGDDPIEHQWEKRRQLVADQIMDIKPTIIGFQEVVDGQQLKDLREMLPGYICIGDIGRNLFATGWFQKRVTSLEKAKNECNPLFYNPEEVTLVGWVVTTFGINPTGQFFYASLPRICTRATFKTKDNKQFSVYNTHLSSSGAWGLKDGNELIRFKQIKLILKNIKKHASGMPTILMGDFNTRFEGNIQKRLTKAGFSHAKNKAIICVGPEETRTGWNNEQLKTIDHILVKGPVEVQKYEVFESPQGKYPSDHRPVCATLTLTQ